MNTRAIAVSELDNLAVTVETEVPPTSPAETTQVTEGGAATPLAVPASAETSSLMGTLRSVRHILLPVSLGLAVLLIWEFMVWVTDYPPGILPAPSVVAASLYKNRILLLENIPATAGVALGGFLIATVTGVALAFLMTWSSWLKDAIYPNIVAFQIVPKVAWAPMFVLWLGIAVESRLGFATFISIFPIIISMTAGLYNTDPAFLRLCRSLTASRWQVLVQVRFPYALPYLFSAMKISITLAMIGVIVGEFITSREGLGFVILTAAGVLDTPLMISSVLVLCLIGLAFYGMVAIGTWLVNRWFGQ